MVGELLRKCVQKRSCIDRTRRSHLWRKLQCVVTLVLAAMICNGCASVGANPNSSASSEPPVSGPTASLSVSTSSLDFGGVLVGGSSVYEVSLTNTGDSNITFSGLSATGPGFAASGVDSHTTLTPGETAALNVTFAPKEMGSAAGSVTVSSSGGRLSIAVAGRGGEHSSRSVALNWEPSTSEVIGYYVYRLVANGTYAKVNYAPEVLTEFTDVNILRGETYTYVVTAIDADNQESDYSDPVMATIP